MASRRRRAERHPVYQNVLLLPTRGGRCTTRGWLQEASVSNAVLRKIRIHERHRAALEDAVLTHTEALRPFFERGLAPGATVSTSHAGFFIQSRCGTGGRLETTGRLLSEVRQ